MTESRDFALLRWEYRTKLLDAKLVRQGKSLEQEVSTRCPSRSDRSTHPDDGSHPFVECRPATPTPMDFWPDTISGGKHEAPHGCGVKWEFGCGACSRRYMAFGQHGWMEARSRSTTLVVPNRWQDADCGTSTATALIRTRSRCYRPVQNRRIKPVEALAKSRFRGLSNRSVRSKCRSPNVRK